MMNQQQNLPIYIGDTVLKPSNLEVKGEYVALLGETFFKIENFDGMEPFFMSIVSSSNHWLFISSTGGLSAGRVSAEQALFPYYTADKLTENSENTGNKAIVRVNREQRTSLWEPFSEVDWRGRGGIYQIQRNIYKNVTGTAVIFEECNHSLGLIYRYAWRTSDAYGFVKTTWLLNQGTSPARVEIVDGLQNILPANITSHTQNIFSSLLDAYKRSELDPETGLAIFALNSTLTDLAEPSESLLAATVSQIGLEPHHYLLSSRQLNQFRAGGSVSTETEVRGQRCAYFAHATLQLDPGAEHTWHLLAEVRQDSAAIVRLANILQKHLPSLASGIERDIALNQANLENIVASADGLQLSNDRLTTAHHFANVMFNVMRGGIFSDGYRVHKKDFIEYISIHQRALLEEAFFSELPPEMDILELHARAERSGLEDLISLSDAYLPLSFSRRHGDPSRPWNRFEIELKKSDGSLQLGYEGNWRDIFQNWEALAYSYPEYIEGMICSFLNATTADGYNPYRITYRGIDWEIPEPNNPWANIGYWGDHQIIYLQKLMEISAHLHPGKLQTFLSQPLFSFANVPYRIKPYADLVNDPTNTIDFDWELEKEIELRVQQRGTDGKLVYTRTRDVLHVTLTEKLLTLLLAKLANFVPEGGIWMNTQRPEWNDANNALVGKGLSVVTLCYLRRCLVFCKELISASSLAEFQISKEVLEHYTQSLNILRHHQSALKGSFSDEQKRSILDGLGQAGSDYRWNYYTRGFSGEYAPLSKTELVNFFDLALQYVEHSLRANRRSDNLYHAYNILHLESQAGTLRVSHLYEMLEGQVAILASGQLSADESIALLESLRQSRLYIPEQHSYILYPDKQLPGFLEKNYLTSAQVSHLGLVAELVSAQDKTLVTKDENGDYHFSGHIRNLKDVKRSLAALANQPRYAELVKAESAKIETLFEGIFHHDQFTGRSGTFFAYEGLGSVYWHMVSKLLLAVQETVLRAGNEPSLALLLDKYFDIRKGLGFNKPVEVYGAFPTDPYSHTPRNQGAKQPGMTGSVKEEILTRLAETGFTIENGCLVFNPLLLNPNELLAAPTLFHYLDAAGQSQALELPADSLAFTFCQVPVILQAAGEKCIKIYAGNGMVEQINGAVLDSVNSRHIFTRDGGVHHLRVGV